MRCGPAHPGPRPTTGHCRGSASPPASPILTQRGPARGSQPAALPDTWRAREGSVSSCHRLPGDLQKRERATALPWPTGRSSGTWGSWGSRGEASAPSLQASREGANDPPAPMAPAPTFPAAALPNAHTHARAHTHTHTRFSSQIGSQAQPGAPAAARAGGSQRGAPKESPGSPSPGQPSARGRGAGPGSRRAGVFPGPAADLLRQQITALVYIGCRRLPSGPAPPGCLHNPEHGRQSSSSNRSIGLAPAPDNTSGPGEPRRWGPSRPPAT